MFKEFTVGFASLLIYFIVVAVLIFTIKILINPHQEYIRKIMHTVCFMSIFVLMYAFTSWYSAALAGVLFTVIVYPALKLFEKHPKYAELFNQRRTGEVKASLLLVFLMMSSMIAFFWGFMGEEWRYIVIVAIMAWGFGDAAAAYAGKKYGKHQVKNRLVTNAKTWEGTLAMFVVACTAIWVTLSVYTEIVWYVCIAVAIPVAVIAALTELISRKGTDTVNVPIATALPLFAIMYFIL